MGVLDLEYGEDTAPEKLLRSISSAVRSTSTEPAWLPNQLT